jgi:hypothetical protein
MAKFTESFISRVTKDVTASGKRVEHGDDNQQGLRLSVGTKKAMWLLACKTRDGRTTRIRLGQYPNLGLADARIKARKERERIRDGFDPIAANREARNQNRLIRDSKTLGDLLELYGTEGRGRKLQDY